MSLVLTLEIRVGNDGMQSSADVARVLESIASRIRDNTYVETVAELSKPSSDYGPGYQLTRGIVDNQGNSVGEFSICNRQGA